MSNSTLLFIQALHGMTYIVLYYSLAQFVNKRVRKELKATGQMLNWALLNGLSRILGGSIGGIFAEYFGIGRVYFFIGILAIIATLGYMFSVMKPKRARTLPQNERTTSGI